MLIPFEILYNEISLESLKEKSDSFNANNDFLTGFANDFEEGSWQYKKFSNFVWDNIKEDALNKKERDAWIGQESTLLSMAANKLRITDNDIAGGEIAEIFLYGIMKQYYGALPIVPKIFYKQNRNDYAKGADSVHIVVEKDEKFSLWFGEAKFYEDIGNVRLNKVVKSVKETLSKEKIKKENSIITGLSDLDSYQEIEKNTREKIKNLLDESTSIDNIKPILHIPIMLVYECSITKNENHYTDSYKTSIMDYQKERAKAYFKKQIDSCESDIDLYSQIKFHLILFPVPDKNIIVDSFINFANVLRG